ncbi:MAG: HEAT repeat domain-containing protein [Simkaniaceae bacterium]|nr:HEAT repeat domain-containing protein [Simkaniaceae bacterium]
MALLVRLVIFLYMSVCFGSDPGSRIRSHLSVRDYPAAIAEWERVRDGDAHPSPEGRSLREAYIRALIESGRDDEAIRYFLARREEGEETDHTLAETLAWGILRRSALFDDRIPVTLASLAGVSEARDVRSVSILRERMSASNALVRLMAVRLATRYGDDPLIREMCSLLEREKVPYVRMAVIEALGRIESREIREKLRAIIASRESPLCEKVQALAALVSLSECCDDAESEFLRRSDKPGLRMMVCEMIGFFRLTEKKGVLLSLLHDPVPDVRTTALNALHHVSVGVGIGALLSADEREVVRHMTEDRDPVTAITAAWLTVRFDPDVGFATLRARLGDRDPKTRYLAAYVLGHTDGRERRRVRDLIDTVEDPFVRVNLALGLIRGGESSSGADLLFSSLGKISGKVMWENVHPFFPLLVRSELTHIAGVAGYPDVMDTLTRLNVSDILAKCKHPGVGEGMRALLEHEVIEVNLRALGILMEVKEEEAIVALRRLMREGKPKVRIRAAILLALSRRDPESLSTLYAGYGGAGRESKQEILEAIGEVGDRRSVPFLLDRLSDPHRLLQVAVATALVKCIRR